MGEDLFAGVEIISFYGDEQALEDGVLVDIAGIGLNFRGVPITRMTDHLWNDFHPFTEGDLSRLRPILQTKLEMAKATESSDHWILPPGLWLIKNELGSWTLMFPEDY